MKKLFKKLLVVSAIAGLILSSAFATIHVNADTGTSSWYKATISDLDTNTGNGLANANIHVAGCYIGTGFGTPCGGGGGGITSLTATDPISLSPNPTTTTGTIGLNFDTTLQLLGGKLSVVGGNVDAITVVAATITNLPGAPIYNNGAAGVGATLTRSTNGTLGLIDGFNPILGSIILVKNEADMKTNGVYVVTQPGVAGGGGSPYIITRTTSSDSPSELEGQDVIVNMGGQAGQIWEQSTDPVVAVGTSNLIYLQLPTGGNFVRQQATGTQVSGQVPFWVNAARTLSKGVANFTFTTATNTLFATNFRIPTTTSSTVGTINQNGSVIFHSFQSGGTNSNFFAGIGAGNFTLSTASNADIGIGANSLHALTTGIFNNCFGLNSCQFTTSGGHNDIFGLQAGRSVTTGSQNVAMGESALGGATNTASDNVAVGHLAGFATTSGGQNVWIGRQAGENNTTGTFNTAVGYGSGNDNNGIGNVYLGDDSDNIGAVSYSIALGHSARITANNQFVVGGSDGGGLGKITNMYLGNGDTNVSYPSTVAYHGTGGSGTDQGGSDVNVVGGISTGAGLGGRVTLATSDSTVSGNTPNGYSDKLIVMPTTGFVGIGQTNPTAALQVFVGASSSKWLSVDPDSRSFSWGDLDNTFDNNRVAYNETTGVFDWIGNGSPTISWDTSTGRGIAQTYHSESTVGNGLASIVGSKDYVAQSAAIITDKFYSTNSAGSYDVCWNVNLTQAATLSSILGSIQFSYTDATDAVTKTIYPTGIEGINRYTGNRTTDSLGDCFMVYADASSDMKISVGYTSVPGLGVNMVYQAHVRVKRID